MGEPLHTETGQNVPKLEFEASLFLDKNCILYGPTKTGKTVIVKHIMSLLNGHIDQVLIISPTETSNRSYEGLVPPQMIHGKLWLPDPLKPRKDDGPKGAIRFLEAVYNRQAVMASLYTRVNKTENLAPVFARLPGAVRAATQAKVRSINDMRKGMIDRLRLKLAGGDNEGRLRESVKKIDDKFTQMFILLYKKAIRPFTKSLLQEKDLTEDEKYVLMYLDLNPRLLLIFDDCAADLKPLFNKEIFRRIFYQGRHAYISAVVCCQDDTDLPANLRKNALVSIFTTPVVATSNFERTSNKFSKEVKVFAAEAIKEIHRGSGHHRKLAYIREDSQNQNIYYAEAPIARPFRFGSNHMWSLCAAVGNKGTTMDASNPYFSTFSL